MNDTEMLDWVAEHLVSFRPVFNTAWMEYVDNDGIEREVVIQDFLNPNPSCLEQLRECIMAATKK